MSLVKTNNFMRGFSPMLSDFFGSDDFTIDRLLKRELTPAVNISEDDKKFEIEFAVPGMSKGDFKVNVENGVLNVTGQHKEETEERKKNYTRQEYSYNSFSRSFTLPENAKEEDIKANYENGLLRVSIAKKSITVPKPKEIAVV